MAEAKDGDKVKVHYTGKLDSGEVFDSSREREPLEFTLGEGSLIPGFERGVIGMNTGNSKTVVIPADDAYGQARPELVQKVEKERYPKDFVPEVGQRLQLGQSDGSSVIARVTEVSDEGMTLDANHPLAGENLTFEIELMEIA